MAGGGVHVFRQGSSAMGGLVARGPRDGEPSMLARVCVALGPAGSTVKRSCTAVRALQPYD
jgi:hypothetical protein